MIYSELTPIQMSSDLLWQIVRKNSSFVVKRDGLQLSREPLNVMNKHSQRYSSIANSKAATVVNSKGMLLRSQLLLIIHQMASP